MSVATVDLPPNEVLREILRTNEVLLSNGEKRQLSSATSPAECAAMYGFLRQRKPALVVEIGMAYGVSALTILTALRENRQGSLISIDPYPQFESARLSALGAIQRAGLDGLHQHIHGPSELELPKLVRDGLRAEFVYIDGHHGFDHAFVDMFFSDMLLDAGGLIAFDDTGWRSVHKVVRYLLKHKGYRELDVGLNRNYKGRNFIGSVSRRIEGRFGSSRYFEKT